MIWHWNQKKMVFNLCIFRSMLLATKQQAFVIIYLEDTLEKLISLVGVNLLYSYYILKLLTWNVQKTAYRITFRLLSSNCLSRPILTIRYNRYPDKRTPHMHTNTVTNNCRLSYAWKIYKQNKTKLHYCSDIVYG